MDFEILILVIFSFLTLVVTRCQPLSIVIVAIVVLGGMGSQTGVVLASIFLIGITEMFRDLEQYRMIAFGGAMVLIMVFKPKGILANRKPTILMHGDKK